MGDEPKFLHGQIGYSPDYEGKLPAGASISVDVSKLKPLDVPSIMRANGYEEGFKAALDLIRPLWPIAPEDSAYIPTCRYCGTQEGTADGEDFKHKETCAWLRLKTALRV